MEEDVRRLSSVCSFVCVGVLVILVDGASSPGLFLV